MPTQGDLIAKMRALAEKHPRAADLRGAADSLEKTIQSLDSTKGATGRMLGAWARARRIWCECSGESWL